MTRRTLPAACSIDCGAVVRLSLQIDAASKNHTREIQGRRMPLSYRRRFRHDGTHHGHAFERGDGLFRATHRHIFAGLPEENALRRFVVKLSRQASRSITTRRVKMAARKQSCVCFGVAEKRIEAVIRAQSLHTIEAVTNACNAGAGCRSCHPLIEDILEDYWRAKRAGTIFAAETNDHTATSDS
jgi:bacterioferritin-associated ferredoxin